MKESFGFIERADVVKEIFFHFSEAKTTEPLDLGDDVEFTIQTRNGKEVSGLYFYWRINLSAQVELTPKPIKQVVESLNDQPHLMGNSCNCCRISSKVAYLVGYFE